MKNLIIILLLLCACDSHQLFAQAVDVNTCPTIIKRNNGNGQASLAAGIFVADGINNPVASNVVGTSYQTVPYLNTSKTGDVNFSWPGGTLVTNLPVITRVWLTAAGSTSGVLSNIKFGPPPPPYLTGGTYRANYAFYNQNMPNSGSVTLEFANPQTNVPLFSCTYDLGGNGPASTPTINCAPTINVQPAAQTLCGATSASFTIDATGVTTYQWQVSTNNRQSFANVSGTDYTGATTATLGINNVNAYTNNLYRVVLTAGGCGTTTSNSALLQANPTPTASFTNSGTFCGLGSRSIGIALTGTGPWSITYTSTPTPDTASNATITGIASSPYFIAVSPAVPTVYSITSVSDARCSNSSAVAGTVSVVAAPSITPSNATACQGSSSFSLPFTSTGSPTNYSITAGVRAVPGFVAISNATLAASPLTISIPSSGVAAGTYDFNVTVSNSTTGCTSTTSSFTLTISSAPAIAATANNYSICSGSSATITATGGVSYSWSSVPAGFSSTASSISVSPTSNTTYTVTGTNAAGCSATGSAAITVKALPVVAIAASATSVQSGTSVSLTASGASAYTWTGPSSYTASGSTIIVAPTASGTYTATGTAPNGCTASASQPITIISGLTVSVTAGSTICQGASGVSLIASGASSYSWSPATGLSATTGATVTANPTTTTVYTVTGVTGSLSGTATTTITVTPSPVTSITPSQVAYCAANLGGSNTLTLSVTSSAAQVYTWARATTLPTYSAITATTGQYARSSASGTSELTSSLAVRTPGSGDQFFRLSFTSGGCNFSYPFTIKSLGTATTDITGTQTVCSGLVPAAMSYTGTATSGSGVATTFSYQWESSTTSATAGFTSVLAATSSSYQPLALLTNTWYRLGITASTGCTTPSYSNVVAITIATAIANNTISTSNACQAGAVLTGSTPTGGNGTYSYQWQSSDNNILFFDIAGATSINYTAPISGTTKYYRRAVSSGTCANTLSSAVAIYPAIVNAQISAGQTVCANGTLTALSVSPTGGDAASSFTYSWNSSTDNSSFASTGTTTATYAPPLTTGTRYYRVNVSRGACTTTSNSATIVVNATPTVSVSPSSAIVCSSSSTTLTASGAVSYSWSPSTELNLATGSVVVATITTSRSYTVTGTDANGCEANAIVLLTYAAAPAAPVLNASNVTICSNSGGKNLTTLITSGSNVEWYTAPVANSSYLVSSPTAVTSAGNYYAFSKSGSCYSNSAAAVSIAVSNVTAPVVAATSFTACAPATVDLTALQPVANSGTALQWHTVASNPSGGSLVNNASAAGSGVYYLYAYSTGGSCYGSASSAVTVTINAKPIVSLSGTTASVCAPSTINLTSYNNTGNSSYTYQWHTAASNPGPSTLVSNATAITSSGTYYLYAISTASCVSNASAGLVATVNPQPTASINTPPTVCSGAGVSISASTNASTPQYAWQVSTDAGLNWAAVASNSIYSGATAATLVLASTSGLANNQYRCVITSAAGCTAISNTELISVEPSVSVGLQPVAVTVLQGNVANFSVTATGSATANFQWQVSTNGGSSYNNIADGVLYNGVNTPDLLINAAALTMNGYKYRCAVSNNCTSDQFSTAAALSVTTACVLPSVVSTSAGYACSGGTVLLTATASAGGTINWYNAATGGSQLATGVNYTTPYIGVSTTYYAEATLGAGCTSARTAVVATVKVPPVASFQYAGPYCKSAGIASVTDLTGTTGGSFSAPAGVTINGGTGAVTLSSSAAGTHTITYTFSSDGCSNTATASISIISTEGLWTGTISSDWHNAANWCSYTVPTASTDVVIPSGLPFMPSTSASVSIHHLNLQSGTTLNIADDAFTIGGVLSGTGRFISSANSTLSFAGSNSGNIGTLYFSAGGNSLNSLSLNETGSGGSLTMGSAVRIVNVLNAVKGTIYSEGYITLVSTANGSARVATIDCANAGIEGDVTVERYVGARRAWRLLGVPTGGAQSIRESWQEGTSSRTENPFPGYGTHITGGTADDGFDQTLTNNPSIRIFNQAQLSFTATPVATTNAPINDHPAYFVLVRGNRSTDISLAAPPATATTLRTRGPLKTCTQVYPTAQGVCDLLGNPYASAIDFSRLTRTNVPNRFFLWDPYLNNVGGYQTFDADNGYVPTPGGGSYGSAPNSLIQSGQAFFIQGTVGPGSLVINENAKVSSSNCAVFRPSADDQKLSVRLYTATNNAATLNDGALAMFSDAYSPAVDNDDARKMNNIDEMLCLIRDNKLLSIEKRGALTVPDTLFLKAYNLKLKQYRLVFTPSGMDQLPATATLIDNFLNTSNPVSLVAPTTVDFAVTSNSASSSSGRFSIVLRPSVVLPLRFTSVKAAWQHDAVEVQWTMEDEIGINRYQVQRSADAVHFTTIAEMTPTGNNRQTTRYQLVDQEANAGHNYYRIVSVDESGHKLISNIIMDSKPAAPPALEILPVLSSSGMISLKLRNWLVGEYAIQVVNASGQLLHTSVQVVTGENMILHLKGSKTLLPGIYQLAISGANCSRVKSFVVMK